MLYRWNTERVRCPLIVVATVSGTPAALMFVMAECRVLWNT